MAPLIDGEEYYSAVRSAMMRARHQILIVGWELHSEVALLRGEEADRAAEKDGHPVVLGDLLQRLVEASGDLRVYLLIWSGSALFALEREHLPRMKRPWDRHPRIRLEWASDTPRLASHHQKFVVIDDRVVFLGGMDLTKSRWDSHEHRVDDRRRRNPGLIPSYGGPYHDAMMVCEGEIARTLARLARRRWRDATSETLEEPPPSNGASPWPRGVEGAFQSRPVHLALTSPEHDGREEVRQVRASFLEQIRDARRFLYIETQYLTAADLVEAMCERLAEADGPEIVLVLPYGCPGVVQSMALDHERDRLIGKLRDADPGGRLGVYWPTLAGGDDSEPFETSVYVHAKVLVADDRVLRIGSANMNNRSMGLDTELDGWIEAEPDEQRVMQEIADFRRRSLSYMLGCDAEDVRESENEHASLVAAIEELRGGTRTLHPFEHSAPEYAKAVRLDINLADPDRPLDDLGAERVLDAIASQTDIRAHCRRICNRVIGALRHHKRLGTLFIAVPALLALLALPPVREFVLSADLVSTMEGLRRSPLGLVGVLVALVLLGSIGVPITVLVTAVGAVIGSWIAAPLALLGVAAASAAGFAFGRLVPDRLRKRVLGQRAGALAERLSRNSVLAIAVLRNLPVAPFALVNAALGVSGVPWTPYLVGTTIGMLPGVVLLTFFGQGLMQLVTEPTPASIGKVLAILLGIVAAAIGAQRVLARFLDSPVRDGTEDG
jgi:phospholipase D1/2